MDTFTMEWAEVAPGTFVVATADRAWIHARELSGGVDAFALPMQGAGTPATTRNLLDAAVGAGQRAGIDELHAGAHGEPPPLTPLRWVWRLAGYYHTTHATPRLLDEAAARFASEGREALAAWARERSREERGHDELARRDIVAMGYDASRVVKALRPEPALALVGYFEGAVRGPDAAACVGYAYALERIASARGAGYVARVEALLPPGVLATRCLRVHSGAGSDAGHVEDTIAVVAGLSAMERAKIALACYETAALCYRAPQGGYLSEDALHQRIAPFLLSKSG